MLLERLREEERFTNHERDVVHFILEHMDQVLSMSTGELARAAQAYAGPQDDRYRDEEYKNLEHRKQ